ncbi:hypothetical protein [Mariniblastus fucicola]|uniref:Tetratricopeptide repeat protein n=1 Tax=Mariniblastus fucicola TaxID=980251 RepID=A0A5B9PM22_9BACT|nr:hypothetical protein [Mariniblastus fucicola]QEG23343.1 hypothetical protein MFFC18_32410 [Mariniblastus fucicola]
MLEKEVQDRIRLSMIKEPETITISSRFKRGEARKPSLSVLNDAPPSKYPRKPTNALDRLEGKADYVRVGVEHFKQHDIFQLSDTDRDSIVEYMNKVLDGPDAEFNREIWDEIGKEGADLAERLTPQLKNEPMFNLCVAINESRVNMLASANRRLDHAIELFAKNDYPTRLPVYAMRLQNEIQSEYRPQTKYVDRVAAMKYWITSDFRARGIEERFAMDDVETFYRIAFQNRDLAALEEFIYCVEMNNTLPKWFQSMALAKYYYQLGYYYRGTGFANSVSEQGWAKLEENAKLAHKYFQEALEINPNYPESATGLMDVSRLGHSDKSEEFWFNKAIEHEVDYMAAYQLRLFGLMPRWEVRWRR